MNRIQTQFVFDGKMKWFFFKEMRTNHVESKSQLKEDKSFNGRADYERTQQVNAFLQIGFAWTVQLRHYEEALILCFLKCARSVFSTSFFGVCFDFFSHSLTNDQQNHLFKKIHSNCLFETSKNALKMRKQMKCFMSCCSI